MNKIKTLLDKSGCNPELVDNICEALDSYKTTLREQYEADYKARIEQAKQVCIRETENHKAELARRVQIFCETKAAAIEAQVARQSALSESAAVSKLKNIVSLLEGVEPNGASNGQATAALAKVKSKIQQVNEEKQKAVAVANRQVAIAEKALKENRRLATKIADLQRKLEESVVNESRQPAPRAKVDQRRPAARPVTTRQTLLENQDRRPPVKREAPITRASGQGFGIDDIAANMDEDLV